MAAGTTKGLHLPSQTPSQSRLRSQHSRCLTGAKKAGSSRRKRAGKNAQSVSVPEEDVYEVEAIIAHRLKPGTSSIQYLLKWKGYPDSENSWVEESRMSCNKLLRAFKKSAMYNQNTGSKNHTAVPSTPSSSSLSLSSSSSVTPVPLDSKIQQLCSSNASHTLHSTLACSAKKAMSSASHQAHSTSTTKEATPSCEIAPSHKELGTDHSTVVPHSTKSQSTKLKHCNLTPPSNSVQPHKQPTRKTPSGKVDLKEAACSTVAPPSAIMTPPPHASSTTASNPPTGRPHSVNPGAANVPEDGTSPVIRHVLTPLTSRKIPNDSYIDLTSSSLVPSSHSSATPTAIPTHSQGCLSEPLSELQLLLPTAMDNINTYMDIDDTFQLGFSEDPPPILRNEGGACRTRPYVPKTHWVWQWNGTAPQNQGCTDFTKGVHSVIITGDASKLNKATSGTSERGDVKDTIDEHHQNGFKQINGKHLKAHALHMPLSLSRSPLHLPPTKNQPSLLDREPDSPIKRQPPSLDKEHAAPIKRQPPSLDKEHAAPIKEQPSSLDNATTKLIVSFPLSKIILPTSTKFKQLTLEGVGTQTITLHKENSEAPLQHDAYLSLLAKWQSVMNSHEGEPMVLVENEVDHAPIPSNFTYIVSNIYRPGVPDPMTTSLDCLAGCQCFTRGMRCNSSKSTQCCPHMAGGHFAYSRAKRIKLPPGKAIFECNMKCPCPSNCPNRVVQHGRSVPLCIFRTHNGRGWGVKAMCSIKANTFVSEYVGEVITVEEAEKREQNYESGVSYLFDLDYYEDHFEFTIDATKFGNVSHFFNHSCNPNLMVYSCWINTADPRLPRLAFFTTRNVLVGEELTFDYQMNKSEGSTTKHGKIPCLCGATNCSGYIY